MQDHAEPQSEKNNPSPERVIALKRLGEIRDSIDAHIGDLPMESEAAGRIMAEFGLEEGAYSVVKDDLKLFARGLFRFIPFDTDGEVLDGIGYSNVGGSMDDLNRSLHYELIHANGDISEKVVTENSKGVTRQEFSVSASSQDESARYERFVWIAHERMNEITQPPLAHLEAQTSQVSESRVKPRTRGGAILRMLKIGTPKS